MTLDLAFPATLSCNWCKASINSGQASTITVRMPGPGQEDHPAKSWLCMSCGYQNTAYRVPRDSPKRSRRPRSGPVRR